MIPELSAATPPTLFGLHFLAGSHRGWQGLADRLRPDFRCVGVDLPGFGDKNGMPGHAVGDMADHIAAVVRTHRPRRWMLAGHSMGAKVSAVLARRAEDGEAGLEGLIGVVTIAGSPPGPEPMDPAQREEMRRWLDGPEPSRRADAQRYVDGNVAHRLDRDTNRQVVDDVVRTNRHAWLAWLDSGSKEDWADRVGVLRTPALVLAGAADAALGPDAQRDLMLPHFAHAEMVTVADAAHLIPMEQPDVAARLITDRFADPPPVPETYQALIASGRVSSVTRAALIERGRLLDRTGVPGTLSPEQMGTLRAVCGRVIPQTGRGRIDLASRLATELGGRMDGWRPAAIPADTVAWQRALTALEAQKGGFAGLGEAAQDAVLDRIAAGKVDGAAHGMSAAQMKTWFEDMRSEATRLAVGHPAFMARMGYSGIGYGGDGPGKPGFTEIGIGQREMWEPTAR